MHPMPPRDHEALRYLGGSIMWLCWSTQITRSYRSKSTHRLVVQDVFVGLKAVLRNPPRLKKQHKKKTCAKLLSSLFRSLKGCFKNDGC